MLSFRKQGSLSLPEFHPDRMLCDWGDGHGLRLSDALTGVGVFGATGSGKTSGPARHLAHAYLKAGFGALILCAKAEERRQWQGWVRAAGRADDLVIVNAAGDWRLNPLDWEAGRPGAGGGLAINTVALLDELAGAIAGRTGQGDGGGDAQFFNGALHLTNSHLVNLVLLAGMRMSLSLMRSIMISAPLTLPEAASDAWNRQSVCAAMLRAADEATADKDSDTREDFETTRDYWLREWPALSERTRSIVELMFAMLVQPFTTRPLRRLFCTDTNLTPEATFEEGKIIIIDLPVQQFRLAGRVANLVWKYCFQIAIMRRSPPGNGAFLRPAALFADEAQNFLTHFDSEFQAVARSAGGCTVYLTQNRESLRNVLGNDDAVDSFLANLQCKIWCQNSGETNEWAARLLGERWMQALSTNVGRSGEDRPDLGPSLGVTQSDQRRFWVDPARFTVLRKGGRNNGRQVDAIVYLGGHLFKGDRPYLLLTFNQD
jgi:hypothetical protein